MVEYFAYNKKVNSSNLLLRIIYSYDGFFLIKQWFYNLIIKVVVGSIIVGDWLSWAHLLSLALLIMLIAMSVTTQILHYLKGLSHL